MRGAPVRRWISVAGLDVVRDPDGRFLVLEDQVRMRRRAVADLAVGPETLREAAARSPPSAPPTRPCSESWRWRSATQLRRAWTTRAPCCSAWPAAQPRGGSTSGSPASCAPRRSRWPISTIATAAWWPGSTGARVPWTWSTTAPTRTASAARRSEGPALLGPSRAGRWRARRRHRLGPGGDDKLVHAYVEEMIRFYLGEEPLLRSIGLSIPLDEPGSAGPPGGARGQAARRDGRRGRGDLA